MTHQVLKDLDISIGDEVVLQIDASEIKFLPQ
jgi:hypothetical protein